MKKLIFLLVGPALLIASCQKPAGENDTRVDDITTEDSIIVQGDTLTYEVITTDPGGSFGVWNGADGVLTSNGLDSITWGNPNYLPSGWRYTFVVPSRPFQAFVSAAARLYASDITINLYKNGHLIKSVLNEAMKGMSKLMLEAQTDNLVGTAANPVVTYQVLVTEPDPSKFESDAWIGQWMTPAGIPNDLNDRVLNSLFPMSSGWKYSFRPNQLPFRMLFGGSPYTRGGGKITINFFVNGQLVKTGSGRDWINGMDYTVQ